ncbi:isochorismatase family protein [Nonomuraea sp. NPDC049695]|uniref:isochorismatase family protein n=1 Tax=Nonomuraea sp. NPDC049695 TaxID=3154734 RepID=UPI0034476FE4
MPDCPRAVIGSEPISRRRAALLICDMQRYFLRPFPHESAPLADLLSNAVALREACAEHHIPVLYSLQPGGQRRDQLGLRSEVWEPEMRADPADTAVPAALTPRPGDQVILGRHYSAFHDTHLARVLADLDRDQLIIVGVLAHIRVLHTAAGARMRDIQPFVVADGVADGDRHHHQTAVDHIADTLGRTMTTRHLITALSQQRLALSSV